MVVSVLMIWAQNAETFTIHDGVADATEFLLNYVTDHWAVHFPARPVPLDPDSRVDAFFSGSDELYVLGEADVAEVAHLLGVRSV